MDKYSGKYGNVRRLLVIWSILGIIVVQYANCPTKKTIANLRRKVNLDSSSSAKKIPLQKSESSDGKVLLKEVEDDPVYAHQLYNNYGVGDKTNYLCTSMDDGKTTRIWGEAVCRKIVKRLYGNKKFKFQVHCAELNVTYGPTNATRGGGFTHAVKRPDGSSYHLMVRCGFIDDSTQTLVNINHLTDDFYFVLTHKWINDKKIIACLKVNNIKNSDFPEVLVKETEDRLEADTIFGIHGIGDLTPDVQGHVCATLNDGVIFGENICPNVLENYNIQVSNVPATCVKQKIKRIYSDEKKVLCVNCPKETAEKISMARCTGGVNELPKSVMVINTPIDGLYYVAKQLNPYSEDWFITSVVDPKKLTKKKDSRAANSSKNKVQNKLKSCLGRTPKQSAKKSAY